MSTILFDIEGLVTYPGFEAEVIRPLEEEGTNIKFWTFSSRKYGYNRLIENGLARYAVPGKCIGDELYRSAKPSSVLSLIKALEMTGLPADEESVKRVRRQLEAYNLSRSSLGIRVECKYPPLIGDDNFLLFESDSSLFDPEDRVEGFVIEETLAEADKLLARKAGYSVIIIPEHPNVWLAGESTTSPLEIVEKIKDYALNWNGEHVVEDLREDITLYREGRIRHPERG